MCFFLFVCAMFMLCWPLAILVLVGMVLLKLIIIPFKILGYALIGLIGFSFLLLIPLLFLGCCSCIF